MVETRAGELNIGEALAMLNAYASVGGRAFDVTLLDIEGRERNFYANRGLDELRASIGQRLRRAAEEQLSFIIRPRSQSYASITAFFRQITEGRLDGGYNPADF